MKKLNEENFDSVIEKEIILALGHFYSIYGVIKAYRNKNFIFNGEPISHEEFGHVMLDEIHGYDETRKREFGYFSFKLPLKKIDENGNAVDISSIDEMKSLIKSYFENKDIINSFIYSQQNIPCDFEKVK